MIPDQQIQSMEIISTAIIIPTNNTGNVFRLITIIYYYTTNKASKQKKTVHKSICSKKRHRENKSNKPKTARTAQDSARD